MEALNELTGLMEQIKQVSQRALNQAITPEVMAQMTPEQKKLIEEGQNAFKFKEGQTLDEKINELQNTLKNVAKYNQ